ncbi:MAG: MBL fold metallo-hydrolase [Candidatus Sericytochromatia bacterium]|nr:MBL fold metallo-hydrolase [Candidatus Tanganyikabacteria bacterium]
MSAGRRLARGGGVVMLSPILALLLAAVIAAGGVPAPDWLVPGDRDRPVSPGEVAIGWHGTAAVEIRTATTTLLIDPHYSRPSVWDLALGPVAPREEVLALHVRRPDAVLVSHSHYDHLLDAPAIARRFGVPLYLPDDGIRIAELAGVASGDIRPIRGGDRFAVGDLAVRVVSSRHPEVATQWLVGGAMPLASALPVRYTDMRTEAALVFLVSHGERTIAHLDAPDTLDARLVDRPVDVAVVSVGVWYRRPRIFARIARALDPAVILPMHHDDFLQPFEHGAGENPFSRWRDALPEISRDAPRVAVVGFPGFFAEFRIR